MRTLCAADQSGARSSPPRRVVELAAAGHSNCYIANLLQVSVKAIEWHLHQCYLKLDIGTRRELARGLEGG